jgi:hypothetical protein
MELRQVTDPFIKTNTMVASGNRVENVRVMKVSDDWPPFVVKELIAKLANTSIILGSGPMKGDLLGTFHALRHQNMTNIIMSDLAVRRDYVGLFKDLVEQKPEGVGFQVDATITRNKKTVTGVSSVRPVKLVFTGASLRIFESYMESREKTVEESTQDFNAELVGYGSKDDEPATEKFCEILEN